MNDINGYYHNLCDVLQEELALYREIANIADKKTDILVDGNINLLQEITELEQNIISNLGKLEDERTMLTQKLAKILQIDSDEITAKYLLEHMPDKKYKKLLSNIYYEMKELLETIDDKNKTNESLIKSALEYIDFSINLLTEVGSAKTNYDADGQNTQKTFHFIDKKA